MAWECSVNSLQDTPSKILRYNASRTSNRSWWRGTRWSTTIWKTASSWRTRRICFWIWLRTTSQRTSGQLTPSRIRFSSEQMTAVWRNSSTSAHTTGKINPMILSKSQIWWRPNSLSRFHQHFDASEADQNLWIAKGLQSKSVIIFREISVLKALPDSRIIVQKYIQTPFLVRKRKVKVRLFALHTSFNGVHKGYAIVINFTFNWFGKLTFVGMYSMMGMPNWHC